MFNFGGLATGLDTQAIIQSMMAVERIPLQRLEAKTASLTEAKSTVSDLLSKVAAIKTAAEDLDDASGFASLVASSDTSAIVATANTAKVPGNFTVDVNRLAQEQRVKTDAFADSLTALGQSGNMDITVGSDAAVSVTVDASDTLTDIAAKINQSGARVSASVVEDGGQYRLMVRGTSTGASNSFTVAGSATIGMDNAANEYQTAQDAEIVLDNSFTISSSTNKFTSVVDGVDLVVTSTTASSANVTLERDSGALIDKLNTFVEAFNDAISWGQIAAGFGALTAKHDELAGDVTLRGLVTSLGQSVSGQVTGLTGRYDMLASVGIHLSQTGKLELDETVLEQALEDDVAAVEKVFTGDPAASVDGAMKKLIAVVDRFTDGDDSLLEMKVESMGDMIIRMQDDAIDIGRRIDDYEGILIRKFTALETLVSSIQAQEGALAGLVAMSTNSEN